MFWICRAYCEDTDHNVHSLAPISGTFVVCRLLSPPCLMFLFTVTVTNKCKKTNNYLLSRLLEYDMFRN